MSFGEHVSEERLEEYCLGSVPATELESVENHLLVCPQCQDRLGETEQYVRTVRQAAAAVAASQLEQRRRRRAMVERFLRPVPMTAAAAAVAALLLLAMILPPRKTRIERPVAVTLELTRGDESSSARAPARKPLALVLDLTGLAQLNSYDVQIVDAAGGTVLRSVAKADRGHALVATSSRLAQGMYWVRVYDPSAQATPLREFGLELE
jgi:hypothetical protein